MSDPTMNNDLFQAGYAAYKEACPAAPALDPVVRKYLHGLPVGDQLASDIMRTWSRGYDTAREAETQRQDNESV